MAIDSAHPSEEVKNLKSTIVITNPLTTKQLKLTGLINRKLIWSSKKNYEYMKVTKDNRLLVGFGGIIVNKKHKKTEPHFPHLLQIEKFLKKLFPYLKLQIDYVWSGTFGVTDNYMPHIEIKKDEISISGCGSQVVCVMSAKYIAEKLTGKKHHLDYFFKK